MAVIKSQYRTSNGKDYDTHHFETHATQVLVGDSRNLDEVINGKAMYNQNLSMLKDDGKYRVSNSVGLPSGLITTETYLLKVDTVDTIVWQTLYDHRGNNVYTRCMTSVGFSNWSNGGKTIEEEVLNNKEKLKTLEASSKGYTEKFSEYDEVIKNITDEMGKEVTAHNHDERYLKINGGVITGDIALANDTNIHGNATSGQSHSLIKISNANQVIVGNNLIRTIIKTVDDVMISTPEGTKRVLHEGNVGNIMGSGSGYAVKNGDNEFTGQQTIVGSGLSLKSSSTGLTFKNSSNQVIARFLMDSSDLIMKLSNTEVMRLRASDNALIANQKLVLQGDGKVWFRMGINASDEGVGFSASSPTAFNFFDWGKGKNVWTLDRTSNVVSFDEAIKINGKKISVQSSQPTNPKTNDIWIW